MEDCAYFTPTPEENDQYSTNRQPFLVQYQQKHNPLLSMNNYTLRVISRNDKNKQPTLLSQRKLALTAINKLFSL
jgi:hypothetical protein